MSVRSSILAVLTLGAAYGLQVHSEIETRTERVGEINVGQIYSTLARLRAAGLVDAPKTTIDGLPLYELTPDGRAEAARWLTSAQPTETGRANWQEMVDHVLIASSLPGADVTGLVECYRVKWRSTVDVTAGRHEVVPDGASGSGSASSLVLGSGSDSGSLRAQAEWMLAETALAWLDQVVLRPRTPTGPATNRPRRGRRPALLQV